MSTQQLTISEDEFEEKFHPQQNNLNPSASWSGWLHETYGPELAEVQDMLKTEPGRVWSIIESDDGDSTVISSGFHRVNVLGYVITEIPCPPDQLIEAVDPDELELAADTKLTTDKSLVVTPKKRTL